MSNGGPHVTPAPPTGPLAMPETSREWVRSVADYLDTLPCAAMLIDRSGHIWHGNARLGVLMGRPGQTWAGHDLQQFYLSPEERQQVAKLIDGLSEPQEDEFFVPGPQGERTAVIYASQPIGDGSPLGDYVILTMTSIAHLKAKQLEAREDYREITRLSDTVLQQALALRSYSKNLEERVEQRTHELREANMEAIYMLAVASEAKDSSTGAHVLRIQEYARTLADAVGSRDAERIGYSAILHDVGKMHVPDEILKKPGPLDESEQTEMRKHTQYGEKMLSRKPFFDMARLIARSHHENWDGSGYPDGLKGEGIPMPARIVHLVDVFDALTCRRVYKPAWKPDQVMDTIKEGSGKLFDPRLVATLLSLLRTDAWNAIGRKCRVPTF